MPLPLTVSCSRKIQIGLPFWYRLTWLVPDKAVEWVCVCVCEYWLLCDQGGIDTLGSQSVILYHQDF